MVVRLDMTQLTSTVQTDFQFGSLLTHGERRRSFPLCIFVSGPHDLQLPSPSLSSFTHESSATTLAFFLLSFFLTSTSVAPQADGSNHKPVSACRSICNSKFRWRATSDMLHKWQELYEIHVQACSWWLSFSLFHNYCNLWWWYRFGGKHMT